MKAVILAAGRGERMFPKIPNQTKALVEVLARPVLDWVIKFIIECRVINEIIIVIGHGKEALVDYVATVDYDLPITTVVQDFSKGYGLAKATAVVEPMVQEDFILLLGDIICRGSLDKIIKTHLRNQNFCTVATQIVDDISGYGVIVKDGKEIVKFVEKPETEISREVITGVYVFSPFIFDKIRKIRISERNEWELTDAINLFLASKEERRRIETVDVGKVLHLTTCDDIKLAEDLLRNITNEKGEVVK